MSKTTQPLICDWQISKQNIKERGQYLLETGLWSDCRFIVGTEPIQQVLECHKLFLAMASPVFEAMFFGGMAEKDPIVILDVQPDAFRALLEYIYTDKINLTSFDQACELCYAAKKYMFPILVEECMKYLWSDLFPKNACRAYEFAKLFEAPQLMEKCIRIIKEQTIQVLTETSFEDVELSTILTVFDQEELNINSELELFNAAYRYATRQSQTGVKVPRLDDGIAHASVGESSSNSNHPTVRDAIKKIRFLTLTPQQFAEGPGKSTLLSESEKFAILMNICSPKAGTPMPDGFTNSNKPRRVQPTNQIHQHTGAKFIWPEPSLDAPVLCCMVRAQGSHNSDPSKILTCNRILLRTSECMNTNVLDCAVTFVCDKNICVYGIQVPAQIPMNDEKQPPNLYYAELLYAHLVDAEGSRLTYTHFTSRVNYHSFIEISFNRPVYIQKNKEYKVGVVLNKVGCYPNGIYESQQTCGGVTFTFSQGQGGDPIRDGLIRSIIFSIPPASNSLSGNSSMSGDHNMPPNLI
ncbi:BTB/POZ domain-containing protein 6-B-like [Anthonomus grandis grandis]|uniref:BTB/POZ domain-containing protein 6-B-like n=1 Tax=Anthonomus grandis grandis TaxID=2921223 RepID=UPI0021668499|nr:BTB/POZ domain-containing protein 6-B-like [Anthonomus grandis grandis]XP_050309731.1 BTB/POZ domain-containing protein 6-B-like [Anthonomus grandis grandis]